LSACFAVQLVQATAIARMTKSDNIAKAIKLNEENVGKQAFMFANRIGNAIKVGDPFCMISNWIFNTDETNKQFKSSIMDFYKAINKSVNIVILPEKKNKLTMIIFYGVDKKTIREVCEFD
jgi:hypothetical protein